jgi:hypothetical protein
MDRPPYGGGSQKPEAQGLGGGTSDAGLKK